MTVVGLEAIMYSPEEIQAGADRVLAARRSGDRSRFIPFEEVKKRHLVDNIRKPLLSYKLKVEPPIIE
ncbi:MAG: hypothetical protein LBK45_07430 [Tannerellaceae bacterium]|jgi:hypothetical protein|nr:hypothetical protein [Tannerellaceae bacterium]